MKVTYMGNRAAEGSQPQFSQLRQVLRNNALVWFSFRSILSCGLIASDIRITPYCEYQNNNLFINTCGEAQ